MLCKLKVEKYEFKKYRICLDDISKKKKIIIKDIALIKKSSFYYCYYFHFDNQLYQKYRVCKAKCGLFIFNIFIILHKLVIIFNNDYQFFISFSMYYIYTTIFLYIGSISLQIIRLIEVVLFSNLELAYSIFL